MWSQKLTKLFLDSCSEDGMFPGNVPIDFLGTWVKNFEEYSAILRHWIDSEERAGGEEEQRTIFSCGVRYWGAVV